jgi:hypothetical protein
MVLNTSLSEEENKFGVEEMETPGLHAVTGFDLEKRYVECFCLVSDVGNIHT